MTDAKSDKTLKKMSVLLGMGERMNKEREKYILSKLLKERRVTVKALSRELYTSEPSIRRDLCSLEKQGTLRRVHGGAVLENELHSNLKIPFVIRELENYDAKVIIARKAAELIRDGDTVMLDGSSSAYALVPFIAQKSNVTVITSGVKTLMLLAEFGINAYSTGGRLICKSYSLVDDDCASMLASYNADIAFFSCRGISDDGMLTDFSIDEGIVRRRMIERARSSILLCADDKIGKTYSYNICSLADIDGAISETDRAKELFEKAKKK